MDQKISEASGFTARLSATGVRPAASRGSSMDGNNWRELYRAALFELDLSKLGERVKAAEEAIRARTSPDGKILSDERLALQDAMNALSILKRTRRSSPSDVTNSNVGIHSRKVARTREAKTARMRSCYPSRRTRRSVEATPQPAAYVR